MIYRITYKRIKELITNKIINNLNNLTHFLLRNIEFLKIYNNNYKFYKQYDYKFFI